MGVRIILDDATQLPTTFRVTVLSPAQRFRRSASIWGAFMAAALASIFIPVLHFVLVPLFIGIAFYMGMKRYKETSFVNLDQMPCPKCQKPLKAMQAFQTADDPTSKIYCYECRSSMRLEVEPTHP